MNIYSQAIDWPAPEQLASWVMHAPHRIWLDSAMTDHTRGRYSLVTGNPLWRWEVNTNSEAWLYSQNNSQKKSSSWDFLRKTLKKFNSQKIQTKEIPGSFFCGGFIGFLSYEAFHHSFLPNSKLKTRHLPLAYFLFCDSGILLDHLKKKSWVFSLGLNEQTQSFENTLAKKRALTIIEEIQNTKKPQTANDISFDWVQNNSDNHEKKSYLKKIEKILQAIHRGDCYQVNLSRELHFKCAQINSQNAAILYLKLRQESSAPQMAFLNLGDQQILSASPETLFKMQKNQILTFPIKGTRPRAKSCNQDTLIKNELLNSEKDRAELLMIADLLRNDLGKVCEYGSVRVPQLFSLESFAQVHHLVAEVCGNLKEAYNAFDVLQALFPGGSITGAPKLKAIEIIDELELHSRGIYTGSIGYMDLHGNANFNIAIRTSLLQNQDLYYWTGGGIVADSKPEEEWQETLNKAQGILKTLKLSTE
ncbi:MAG: aminodeoxychorismate synthase component I [Deltaproteobacteria bacterium]|nr:aminodeoxychorismate synthase component I [Deltaproteobacteria bacterium]